MNLPTFPFLPPSLLALCALAVAELPAITPFAGTGQADTTQHRLQRLPGKP